MKDLVGLSKRLGLEAPHGDVAISPTGSTGLLNNSGLGEDKAWIRMFKDTNLRHFVSKYDSRARTVTATKLTGEVVTWEYNGGKINYPWVEFLAVDPEVKERQLNALKVAGKTGLRHMTMWQLLGEDPVSYYRRLPRLLSYLLKDGAIVDGVLYNATELSSKMLVGRKSKVKDFRIALARKRTERLTTSAWIRAEYTKVKGTDLIEDLELSLC